MFFNKVRSFFKSSRGATGLEYALAMTGVVGITVGFVAVSSDALRQGVDSVSSDLSDPQSLSRTVGEVDIEEVDKTNSFPNTFFVVCVYFGFPSLSIFTCWWCDFKG